MLNSSPEIEHQIDTVVEGLFIQHRNQFPESFRTNPTEDLLAKIVELGDNKNRPLSVQTHHLLGLLYLGLAREYRIAAEFGMAPSQDEKIAYRHALIHFTHSHNGGEPNYLGRALAYRSLANNRKVFALAGEGIESPERSALLFALYAEANPSENRLSNVEFQLGLVNADRRNHPQYILAKTIYDQLKAEVKPQQTTGPVSKTSRI